MIFKNSAILFLLSVIVFATSPKNIYKPTSQSISISSINPLQIQYSYGLHDFIVQKDFHTIGINAGIYAQYSMSNSIYHYASFEAFIEHDENEQDPDHIPVWFRANYQLKNSVFKPSEYFTVNTVFDFNWKMNTVSSVEQYVKTGLGVELAYKKAPLAFSFRLLEGYYYLEIDDDVPKTYGFGRSDLSIGFTPALAFVSNLEFDLTQQVSAHIGFSMWYAKDEWLEKFLLLEVKYHNVNWLKDSSIIFALEQTKYNLSNYRKDGIDILPWDKDILFKISIKKTFK